MLAPKQESRLRRVTQLLSTMFAMSSGVLGLALLHVLTSDLSVSWLAMGLLGHLATNGGDTLPSWLVTSLCVMTVIGLFLYLPLMEDKRIFGALVLLLAFSQFPILGGMFTALTVLGIYTALAWRIYKIVRTLHATAKPTLGFPLLPHLFPTFSFSRDQFFRADGAPDEVATLREESFDKMDAHWKGKFPKSIAMAEKLRSCFSDLRFASGNRVFLPFKKILDSWCDPCTVAVSTDRMILKDIDGEESYDIAGSYGVNVVGYDRYKEFITQGWEMTKDVGCVLGPVHPILLENIDLLKQVSNKEEVSFHCSGTEAVMCAVRLARFNTGRKLVVLFGGAYHGWWDGVQPLAGNEKIPTDILTLVDLSPATLEVIRLRSDEIAAVMVNPLQSFHPNQPPPSDLSLATHENRNAKETDAYKNFLGSLRQVCDETGVVFIFDEVYTGFRLAPGGAQEYFDVQADMVCYGKTLGGGMPNGIVCGPSRLMSRCDESKPLRVAYVIGTFAAHPLLLGSMNGFLKWSVTPEARNLYNSNRKLVKDWCNATNALFEKEDIPLKTTSYASVWTMLYTQPGRYHWMLQYYLKDEGINLSWVGTGRLNFSLDFTKDDLAQVQGKMLRACKRMQSDGWWWVNPDAAAAAGNARMIKLTLGKELAMAFLKTRIIPAARSMVDYSKAMVEQVQQQVQGLTADKKSGKKF